MIRHTASVLFIALAVVAAIGSAQEPIPVPEDLWARYHEGDEGEIPGDFIFECSGSQNQTLIKNGNYDLVWGALFADGDPAVDGYQYRVYKNYYCGVTIRLEDTIEDLDESTEYSFRFSPSIPARYCWHVRGLEYPLAKPFEPEPEYGMWSDCCCFDVIEVCRPLTAPAIIDIGGEICDRTIEVASPDLKWVNVSRERGYRVEVRDASDKVVVRGTVDRDETTTNLGRLAPGEYTARVQAFGDNEQNCDSEWSVCPFRMAPPDKADFGWWPKTPKVGQTVRCADQTTGRPQWWHWNFDDGGAAEGKNPSWRFAEAGAYEVSMMVGFDSGQQTVTKTIEILGKVSCGDGICEGSETAWSCPADCALGTSESGRAGGRDHKPSIPIAVGGVEGVGGTFWKTEGSVFNPGDEAISFVIEFSPLNGDEILHAGPFRLRPKQGLYWDNIVGDLFRAAGNGSLWLDASGPVLFQARSYNSTASGEYGQGVTGIRERLTLARGEGKVYLIGLREDDAFRTNLFFQEVDGKPVTVLVDIFDPAGKILSRTRINVRGHSAVRRSLSRLGVSGVASAYATAQVVEGYGRMAATGSVIDNVNGDPATTDALHPEQVLAKTAADEDHQLVAVVAHTRGLFQSRWRSEVAIVNPTESTQTVRLEYATEFDETGAVGDSIESTVTVQPGEQKTWTDVLGELFGLPEEARTQGALHVYSPDGVIVHSRTFNQQGDTSTKGQTMPALKSADLIALGETGQIIGLRHTDGTRTNLGVAGFSDQETEVELSFFNTRLSVVFLGTMTEKVPAKSHLQLTRVFEKLGLTGTPMTDIAAYVTVKKGGAVYAYGSVVDNGTGDATTYLAATE